MGKMSVVHIITQLELGGAQQNTLFTVSHLDRTRFDVVLIAGPEGLLVEEAMRLRGVTVHLLPELVREIRPLKDLKAVLKMQAILTRIRKEQGKQNGSNGADIIVHTHCSKAGILGRWAAYLAGIKCIVHTYHGFGFHKHQPALLRFLYVLAERLTAGITAAFIMVSRANLQRGIDEKIVTGDKAVLIRSGIDIEEFSTVGCDVRAKKRELVGSDATPIIAMIACLKPQKAPLDFVRAAHLVLRGTDRPQFLLVGDGILRSEVEALARTLGIDHRLNVLGWRTDIAEIMRSIDVLVLTSLWEGLPRVLPQAMSLGVPIVATGVDGTPEAVCDGVNGYVLAPGDVEGVAQKIGYLLEHPEKAREMGNNGKKMVHEYDIWKMMHEQETLYLNLLETRGSRSPGSNL